jgi:hypothetical protein
MMLDPATIEALLPCYLCGDLPVEVARAIEAAMEADAGLRARLTDLVGGREACREALAAVAPDLPAGLLDLSLLAARPLELPAAGPAPWPPPAGADPIAALVGMAAGAMLLLAGVGAGGAPPPEVTLAARAVEVSALAATPAALVQGLAAAGAPPALQWVPDLSAQGFALVDARLEREPRLGIVVTYEKDGQRYHCRIYGASPTRSVPDETRVVRGVVLRGFDDGAGGGVVAWTGAGRTCLFSGPAPVAELLAVVAARLGGAAG